MEVEYSKFSPKLKSKMKLLHLSTVVAKEYDNHHQSEGQVYLHNTSGHDFLDIASCQGIHDLTFSHIPNKNCLFLC